VRYVELLKEFLDPCCNFMLELEVGFTDTIVN